MLYPQHFYNILNIRYSNIFYSFNVFTGTLLHNQPNPFPPFFFFFFLPFFLNHMSQPYTFCNALAQFKSKAPPTPLPSTTHLIGILTLLAGYFFFFFFHTTNPPLYRKIIVYFQNIINTYYFLSHEI